MTPDQLTVILLIPANVYAIARFARLLLNGTADLAEDTFDHEYE